MHHSTGIITICGYTIMPATDGGRKGIYLFEKYLANHVNLIMVGTKDNKPEEPLAFRFIPYFGRSPLRYINPFFFLFMLRLIKREKISVVLIEHTYFGWLTMLLRLFGLVKVVVHHHNIESNRFKSLRKKWWRLLWYYEKFTCRYAHLNLFITAADEEYAIRNYKVSSDRCLVVPFGTTLTSSPSQKDRYDSKKRLQLIHSIPDEYTLFLFAASYGYEPNLKALHIILDEINPLLQKINIKYKIIICGGGLPPKLKGLEAYENDHVLYAGFVEDISLYFSGCDIFLNPVMDGGGIKTKLVEALGYGMSAVSSIPGAEGVPVDICGGKLLLSENKPDQYLAAIKKLHNSRSKPTPESFYEFFNWPNITKKLSIEIKKM
jgi:glycosyltransferase involved in cell wall biosynthesis